MPRYGRIGLTALILALCVAGAWGEISRFRLGRALRQFERNAARDFLRSETIESRVRARQELTRIEPLLERFPRNSDLRMVIAVHYRILDRFGDAARQYEIALETDYRPEILLNLGVMYFELGSMDDSVRVLAEAVAYDPSYLSVVPIALEGPVREASKRLGGDLPGL